jgi:heat shock protein HslJ
VRRAVFLALAVAAGTLVAACSTSGGGSGGLTGTTWYLTSGSETTPAWQYAVPPAEQANYTITFNTDGNFAGKADCNQIGGTYKTSGSDGLTITPTTSTMAFCGEASFDTLFVHALGDTTNYKIENGLLTLTQKNGTLQFTSTKPTATAEPPASPAEVPQGSPGAQGLTGVTWKLTGITEKVPAFQGAVPADQQANYTITFNDDKSFNAKADCNNLSGTYETGDPAASSGPLSIKPGPMTLDACPEGSLGDLFVIGLGSAERYAIADNVLTLTVVDGGTLQFQSSTKAGY